MSEAGDCETVGGRLLATRGQHDTGNRRMGVKSVALLAVVLIAGCLGATDPAAPAAPPAPATVTFETDAGTIVGNHYPADANEVVLLLHGASGVRDNYWGDKSLPDYSPARLLDGHGFDVVAIDRPGYGDSTADATSVELEAAALDAVAATLRADHDAVHVIGISMGAFMAGVTQALHGSFDSVVVASWAHGAVSDEARSCIRDATTCPGDGSDDFHFPNAEPAIINEVRAGYQTPPPGISESFGLWQNMAFVADDAAEPAQDAPMLYDVTSRVEVPVLVVLGVEDWYLDHDVALAECDNYGGACEVLEFEETGHMVLHHRNRVQILESIADWIQAS